VRDPALYERALTHRSAVVDEPLESYERLEFLGDSVIGWVVASELYRALPEAPEGDLARMRAHLVSEPSLASAARTWNLGELIRVGPGEALAGGRSRDSILSDVFEAIVGAVYLDRGIQAVRRVVRAALGENLRQAIKQGVARDPKSALQERLMALKRIAPVYRIVSSSGADHRKTFTAEVTIEGAIAGRGSGNSKKRAEQVAASIALERLSSG
jgi:ribonuclease-3